MIDIKNSFSSYPVAFGGASLSGEGGGYGFGSKNEVDAINLVKNAYELGFRVFDTAPIYGFGTSEIRLGKAIKEIRDDIFVVTKCGIDWDQKKNVAIRNDPKTTLRMLEESLKRLNDDIIDLYMVHWPDQNVDIRKTLDVLTKAQAQNKIRYIGLCNTNLQELALAKEVAKIDVVQNQFNIFENSAKEMFPQLSSENIKFMSWGTLDKGIITGSVNNKRTFDEHDVRSSETPWWNDEINLPKINQMEKILPFLEDNGHTGLELALSYNMSSFRRDQVKGLCLCGAKTTDQLKLLQNAINNSISNELLDQLEREFL